MAVKILPEVNLWLFDQSSVWFASKTEFYCRFSMSAPEDLCMLQKFQGSHREFFIPIGTVSNILNKIGKIKVTRISG